MVLIYGYLVSRKAHMQPQGWPQFSSCMIEYLLENTLAGRM